jgi:ketosteroid isomerase-like protein
MESVLERLHPEIEWVEPELEGLLYGGTHHGIEAVTNEVLALIPQTWERAELHPETWIDGGNTVVVVGEFSARCKGGDERTWRFAHAWEIRDGKGSASSPSSTRSRRRGRWATLDRGGDGRQSHRLERDYKGDEAPRVLVLRRPGHDPRERRADGRPVLAARVAPATGRADAATRSQALRPDHVRARGRASAEKRAARLRRCRCRTAAFPEPPASACRPRSRGS